MRHSPNDQHFPRAHLWLLIPFAISVFGFYFTYWSRFNEVPFRQHAHGLSATAWYVLLILQPWLYHNKPISYHKKAGFIALFFAGAVVFSALQVIPFQIVSTDAHMSSVLRYGLSFYDLGALAGFSFSVLMAMLNSRETPKHARWMISTAFWALQPAFVRLVFFTLLIANGGNPPVEFLNVIYICLAITAFPLLIMIFLDFRKEKKVYAAYACALLGTSIFTLLIQVFGTAQWWIDWCNNVLGKGM